MKQFLTECSCGSKLPADARFDARGIFLRYACDTCWSQKQKTYRPEVLKDPEYYCDEQIEPD